jgi:hypothetical protein
VGEADGRGVADLHRAASVGGVGSGRDDVSRSATGAAGYRRQKPSSARPTQLTANIDEAMAAIEAKVTMVLTDRMIEPRCRQRTSSVERVLLNQGRIDLD